MRFYIIPAKLFLFILLFLILNTMILAEDISNKEINTLKIKIDELEKRIEKIEETLQPKNTFIKNETPQEKPRNTPPAPEKTVKKEPPPEISYNFSEKISKTGYNRLGDNIVLGNATFSVDAFLIGKVVKKDTLNRSTHTDKKYVQIYITITNNSNSIIEYFAPGGIFGKLKLEDNKGNEYLPVNFGFNTSIEGKVEGSVPISPKSRISDILIFDEPEDGASALLLIFPAEQFKQKGLLRVVIPIKK
ncbi:hypothetical protein HZA55_07930 [Candidatus Poribacteria bacterium]|nr:hypothetical protein [Candidatus Poribacteria bacterium]